MNLLEIILRAKNAVRQSSVINAMWIEGSYATGTFNQDSDIDVWLDIVPSEQEAALIDFRKAIENVVNIRSVTELHQYSGDPLLIKAKLYIEDSSDDNRIELDMQESTRGFLFNRDEHDIITLFDKSGAIRYRI